MPANVGSNDRLRSNQRWTNGEGVVNVKSRLAAIVVVALTAALMVISSAGAVSTTLVVNEIDYDQPSTDAAEFVELKNVSSSSLNLDPFTVELVNGTGGGATVYQTIDLPPVSLAAGDYFVVCANATTTANCDLAVAPDTNLVQNGAPDAVGVRDGSALVDTVSYEGDTGAPYTEGSGAGLEDNADTADKGVSRCPDGTDTDQNNADLLYADITPGAGNDCPSTTVAAIHEIQGASHISPLAGENVVTEGIVTATRSNGFWLQDPDPDADDATSEGLFVFTGDAPSVSVGDDASVTGTVTEFRPGGSSSANLTTTEPTSPTVEVSSSGNPLPAPTVIGTGGPPPPKEGSEDDAHRR